MNSGKNTAEELVKQSNFLCVSLMQTPKSRGSRHDGLNEKRSSANWGWQFLFSYGDSKTEFNGL